MHPLGVANNPLSHLDSDDDLDPKDDILAMQLPEGFRLQERPPPTVLDRTLVKRCVILRRGLGWFQGQITRTVAPKLTTSSMITECSRHSIKVPSASSCL